jgi:hypothetical protein
MTQSLYIDPSIGGTGGAGTSVDPYRGWIDFRNVNNSRNLVTEAIGVVSVFLKGLCTDPNNAATNYTLAVAASGSNSTNYFHFQPWPGFESSTFSTMPGFYSTVTGSGTTLISFPDHCRFTQLKIHFDGTGSNQGIGLLASTGSSTGFLQQCWVRCRSHAVLFSSNHVIRNNIVEVLGAGSNGIRASAAGAAGLNIDFNTVIADGAACGIGIDPRSATANVRNNIVYVINGGTWTSEYVTDPSASSGNNAGQLASGSQPGEIGTVGYVQISSNPFSSGYYPASGGVLANTGVAVSGVTTDFAGVTRGTPPDIGALEVAAVVAGAAGYRGRAVARGMARGIH